MIGNSPKSDINPAWPLACMRSSFPHAHTWVLEKQEIAEADGRLLVVDRSRIYTSISEAATESDRDTREPAARMPLLYAHTVCARHGAQAHKRR